MVLILRTFEYRLLYLFEYGVIPNGAYTAQILFEFKTQFEYGVIPNGAYTKQ